MCLKARSVLPLTMLLAAALVLTSSPAQAQRQTGSLVITVVDIDGKPLPEVAITLEGKNLPGFHVEETNEQGRARFAFLPPGTYIAEYLANGYATYREEYKVALGSTLNRTVKMVSPEMVEEVTISGTPLIDVTETGITQTFDEEKLEKIQIGTGGRSYQNVLDQAGGVSGTGSNPNVHGSTIGENRFLIDGVDTTDPVTSTWGTTLNYDTIEAVEFITGGFKAEYGQATGGIVNLVTKSGGNDLEGTLDIRYDDEGFYSGEQELPQENRITDATFGGPIIEDKLWFFVGAGNVTNAVSPSGARATRDFSQDAYLGKLTLQVNQDHRMAVQYNNDPATIDNVNAGALTAIDGHYQQVQGAEILSGTYWGTAGENWDVQAQASYYKSKLDSTPQTPSDKPPLINLANGAISQQYDDAQFSVRRRNQAGAKIGYTTEGRRWHEVKFGGELQVTRFTARREQPGPYTTYTFDPDTTFGEDAPIFIVDRLESSGTRENEGTIRSFFIQDTYHPTDRVTVDVGIRYDHAAFDDDTGTEAVDFGLLQPRIGAAWDVRGDRRHSLSVHFARMMDPSMLSTVEAANQRTDATYRYRFDAAPGPACPDYDPDDIVEGLELCAIFGGSPNMYDDDVDAQYVDEFTIGYKWAATPHLVAGARYVWRETNDIIEDIWDPSLGVYIFDNIDELTREYEGVEFDVSYQKGRWNVFGSWTISETKGNIEYTQGRGADWDFAPFHTVNRFGLLSNDETHVVKVHGWVDLPLRFEVAWDLDWGSGRPYNRVDSQFGFDANGEPANVPYSSEFIERGAARLPEHGTLDVEVRKGFEFGNTHLYLIGSITNLTNEHAATSRQSNDPRVPVDENGDEFMDPGPGEPGFNIDDAADLIFDEDSGWGDDLAFQTERRFQVGLRLTW